MEEKTTQSISLPLFCQEGHQIYIVRFPQLDRFGFACGVCHTLGTALTHGNHVLEIHPVNAARIYREDKRAELVRGMGMKAEHVNCGPKKHNLMAFQFTEGFGIGCIHCKHYSLTFEYQEITLEIRIVRELENHDPHIKPLASRKVPNNSAFEIN